MNNTSSMSIFNHHGVHSKHLKVNQTAHVITISANMERSSAVTSAGCFGASLPVPQLRNKDAGTVSGRRPLKVRPIPLSFHHSAPVVA